MYPFLSGRAAAVTLAAVMSEVDVADAAARTAADNATWDARARAGAEVRRNGRRTGRRASDVQRWWSLSARHQLLRLPSLRGRPPAAP
jgi:hypothetical protein